MAGSLKLKIKQLPLAQLSCQFSAEAMAPLNTRRDALERYLAQLSDKKAMLQGRGASEFIEQSVNDLLLQPINVALYKEESASGIAGRSIYIPLDFPHLMPFFQQYAPKFQVTCLVRSGKTLKEIIQWQARRVILNSGLYSQKSAGYLEQLKTCDDGLFNAKQLSSIFGISESSLYPPKKCSATDSSDQMCSDVSRVDQQPDGLLDDIFDMSTLG
ncbi:hypothetical protein [Oceanospirillum sanctuarii]|uniref:hypothetical protein n=1 Tax=Oceanospirillum sanctuarii TaxID=1434821 RepID=UPI00111F90D1|nr:hypothetical protein [Oceanospirillum sanctuarii]